MKTSPLIPKILAILAHHGFQWPETGIPKDLEIRRVRAGKHQRTQGAWSWFLSGTGCPDIGSQWPASEIARTPPEKLSLYDNPFHQTAILKEGP